ncbi:MULTISPECIES: cytochrome c [Pseudoalteromonas]|uniref:c-type cytochrome n=1 Tax=Pseudoalteromonas TaxID=53246 RepID=UPI0015FF6A11|nr:MULTISPECIES: cytochrome c [Pseudoalteromonas]MBB1300022.1 cytochrome c [Pseudoalteromonas sp. SR44-8]MBB1397971.1 cytochrome c [Pseudoalteromonas sp. SG44-8]MBB1409400.1 cytochrome c [Pseudoalteromonas sp. SG44-17]MBB1504745.1 cytochrome c [Pseudoalteromonas sp. SG41-1]|tara:strand:- start:9849 stop:10301 length:453 start_codon:yes stop_codon:yes gene_type:complete
MKLKQLFLGATLCALTFGATANSVFEEPSDAIEYRQAAFSMIRVQIGDMGDMLKGKVPFDAEQFKHRANNAAALSKMPWEAFVAGSDKGDTSALPAIWSDNETFMKKAAAFQQYADELAVAAQTGDKKVIAKAFGPWAKGCKDCHTSFKD